MSKRIIPWEVRQGTVEEICIDGKLYKVHHEKTDDEPLELAEKFLDMFELKDSQKNASATSTTVNEKINCSICNTTKKQTLHSENSDLGSQESSGTHETNQSVTAYDDDNKPVKEENKNKVIPGSKNAETDINKNTSEKEKLNLSKKARLDNLTLVKRRINIPIYEEIITDIKKKVDLHFSEDEFYPIIKNFYTKASNKTLDKLVSAYISYLEDKKDIILVDDKNGRYKEYRLNVNNDDDFDYNYMLEKSKEDSRVLRDIIN